MMKRCCQPLWAVVACLLAALSAQAAEPLEENEVERRLVHWVGADAGVCLELNSLPRHWDRFRDAPLWARLHDFGPLASWLTNHAKEFVAVSGEIQRRTGASGNDLFRHLFGRQILFAIWPPADAAASQPSALLLVESSDRELLRRTLDKLIAGRRQAGRWRGKQNVEIGPETFAVDAVVPDDEQSQFFITAAGDVAVIATNESLLRSVLERRAGRQASATSLASLPAYVAATERLAAPAAARLFVNPRAWDAALAADLKRKPPGSQEARSQAAVVATWRAMDYVIAAAHVAPHLAFEFTWSWRAEELPAPVRDVAAGLVGPAAMAAQLPKGALVALAGHADLKRLARLAIAEQWANESAGPTAPPESLFGWALSAGLGPDWAAYLIARPAQNSTEPAAAPIDLVAGVQTQPLEPGDGRPALARTAEPLLHAFLSAAVEAANRRTGTKTASLGSLVDPADRQRPITVVSGLVPGRPHQDLAYCVDDLDRFWFGTSAAALARPAPAAGECLRDDAALAEQLQASGSPSGLVYVDMAGWRRLAQREPEAIERMLWKNRGPAGPAKQRRFRELLAIAGLADRLLLVTHIDEASVYLSFAISADQP